MRFPRQVLCAKGAHDVDQRLDVLIFDDPSLQGAHKGGLVHEAQTSQRVDVFEVSINQRP